MVAAYWFFSRDRSLTDQNPHPTITLSAVCYDRMRNLSCDKRVFLLFTSLTYIRIPISLTCCPAVDLEYMLLSKLLERQPRTRLTQRFLQSNVSTRNTIIYCMNDFFHGWNCCYFKLPVQPLVNRAMELKWASKAALLNSITKNIVIVGLSSGELTATELGKVKTVYTTFTRWNVGVWNWRCSELALLFERSVNCAARDTAMSDIDLTYSISMLWVHVQ